MDLPDNILSCGAGRRVALLVLVLPGCGDNGFNCADPPPRPHDTDSAKVAELIERYQDGVLGPGSLAEMLTLEAGGTQPLLLQGTYREAVLLNATEQPHRATRDVTIASAASLVLALGATLNLAQGVTLTVKGQLYAIGGAAGLAVDDPKWDNLFLKVYGLPCLKELLFLCIAR